MDFTATLGLLFVGFILLVLKVLVIPGIGLAGVAGFGILAWACFEIWTAQGPLIGLLSIGATALVSGWTLWSLARSSWGRKMILDSALDSEDTGSHDLQRFLGRSGSAESPLRPGGVVLIDGQRMDAVANNGQWIQTGEAVRVTSIQTNNLYVDPIPDSHPKRTEEGE